MATMLIFWGAVFLVLYTYLFYPLVLCVLRRIQRTKKQLLQDAALECKPMVTVVIAARNEEANIVGRLENLIAQEYPANRLEIVVVSDGSTDQTVTLGKSFIRNIQDRAPEIRFVEIATSHGKPMALNRGVAMAGGDIVVFADCRQRFDPRAIDQLVACFIDSSVGCVSGELLFWPDDQSRIQVEMGAYWRYEKLVRKLESDTGSVIGATGAIYAIRKALFRPLSPDILLDDVVIPMQVLQQGYRVIFCEKAKAFDRVSKHLQEEWRRKVRTLAGNWQLFSQCPEFFQPSQNTGLWRLISHKTLRLLVPFLLPVILLCSLLAGGPFFFVCFAVQLLFYIVALLAALFKPMRQSGPIKLAYFFCVLNCAVVAGCFYWASGQTGRLWGHQKMR